MDAQTVMDMTFHEVNWWFESLWKREQQVRSQGGG